MGDETTNEPEVNLEPQPKQPTEEPRPAKRTGTRGRTKQGETIPMEEEPPPPTDP